MRVRHLQSYLVEQNLVHTARLKDLEGARIGVDAVHWLRSIQALKDPFADALGGVPPGIFGFVDKELDHFQRHKIRPLFVFQGVAPGPSHSMFVNRLDNHMDQAWTNLANGQNAEAQKCFAVSTSRINGDFVYFIFHHLKAKGYECLQAPYFAGAQLAHLMERDVISSVFGPPGLLLYGVTSVITQITFSAQAFDWVDLKGVLLKWGITRDQFVDACLLAGTEYCLTYPYLNLTPVGIQQNRSFTFDAAVNIIKQATLTNLMTAFPTEETKSEHIDGYCICKVLVENSPVLHLQDHTVRPLSASTGDANQKGVPTDFSTIMGERLPNSMYYLMLQGIISHKLPQALAKGEWTDKAQPLVDTQEYRDTVIGLEDYRNKALGLVARHLHTGFQKKKIAQKAFWEPTLRTGVRFLMPVITKTLKWEIKKDALEAEMKRQGVTKVDFKFCLNWHDRDFAKTGPLVKNLTGKGSLQYSEDPRCLAALVHFMVLEHLDLISQEDGSATVLGNLLKDSPAHMQEQCLVALELMKIGMLNDEPFTYSHRPFPEAVRYPSSESATPATRSRMLLSRVLSLTPMKLKSDMWNADVEFDLTAFHSVVRVLKRTLRHLVEASLTSVLLQDLSRVKLLPANFMTATPSKENHYQSAALLPPFMLPRACMGIVLLFFLDYEGEPSKFGSALFERFPCCLQAVEDLKVAFAFWEDFKRCVEAIAEPLGVEDLYANICLASEVLHAKQRQLNIFAAQK